jgi:hypothetical protein
MNKIRIFFLLLIPILGHSQEPPAGTNQITISGVNFIQVVDSIQSEGYEIKWLDDNYKTVRTTFREAPDPRGRRSSYVYVSLRLKVKDSTAFLTAKWYNAVFLNAHDAYEPIDSELQNVEWAFGDALQLAFRQMEAFAKSFGKPLSYSKAN